MTPERRVEKNIPHGDIASIYPETAEDLIAPENAHLYLRSWFELAQQGKLAALPMLKVPSWRAVTISHTDSKNGVHAEISLPGVPAYLTDKLPKAAVDMELCSISPLHGDFVVGVYDEGDTQKPLVQNVLDRLGITTISEKGNATEEKMLTNHAEISPPPEELITGEFARKLFAALELNYQNHMLSYVDPDTQHLLYAAIKICVERNFVSGHYKTEWWSEEQSDGSIITLSAPGETFIPEFPWSNLPYQQLLHKSGLGPYDTDLSVAELKEELGMVLSGSYNPPLPAESIKQQLLKLDISDFIKQFPPFIARITALNNVFLFATDLVAPYYKTNEKLVRMAGGIPLGQFPATAVRKDLNYIPNQIIQGISGDKVNLLFEKSNGRCSHHSTRPHASMIREEAETLADSLRYMRTVGYSVRESQETPGEIFGSAETYKYNITSSLRSNPDLEIAFNSAQSVCDLGCGHGASTLFAANLCPQASITTSDDTKTPFLEVFQTIGPRLKNHVKSSARDFLEGATEQFDVAFIVKASHIISSSDCVNLARCVKEGGYVFQVDGDILLPNEMFKYFEPIFEDNGLVITSVWRKKSDKQKTVM